MKQRKLIEWVDGLEVMQAGRRTDSVYTAVKWMNSSYKTLQ